MYQGALRDGDFAGFTDFLELDPSSGTYLLWDTKVARSIKPYYAVQLCCYAEMLGHTPGTSMPENFGIILGTLERPQLRVSEYFDYYLSIKEGFLKLQQSYDGDISKRPEPEPRADHGSWTSEAETFFDSTDHLVRVAGISANQIKKLRAAGIDTLEKLANSTGVRVEKMRTEALNKLVTQAGLQHETRESRKINPEATAAIKVLPNENGKVHGFHALPAPDPADVYFDMEGYPIAVGGLEYLWGAGYQENGKFSFRDWWAHDRNEEREALRGFITWVHTRWKENPDMHIYHYAPYEVGAVRRLMSRHDTCQDEVNEMLRNGVFVDLFHVVKKALLIGDKNYSIKTVEKICRSGRTRDTEVATSIGSVVHYARWIDSGESKNWQASPILKGIRDYNEDDCRSTMELADWLRDLASRHGFAPHTPRSQGKEDNEEDKAEAEQLRLEHQAIVNGLRARQGDSIALTLADLMDFHRREALPEWWRLFEREKLSEDELRDDPACIAGITSHGSPRTEARSLVQEFRFDPSQECKGKRGDTVMFQGYLDAKSTIHSLDLRNGTLELKISSKKITDCFGGTFPNQGSLVPYEIVSSKPLQDAIRDIARSYLHDSVLPESLRVLLGRIPPSPQMQVAG
ncbi:MAG: TM0106 family RecB-like putative nuclease, partial [Proteobacteria bacterium]|nr:TM0106 family RecB-like putative nuclease [Pseudomonadota bacterium]